MQGPSVSSAYHTIETSYPAFYDGRVCVPGGASDAVMVDGHSDESRQTSGSVPLPPRLVILPNKTTIAFIPC